MDFKDLAKKRYSCRKYKDQLPDRELLTSVLETARLAPSAKNIQPWKFVVIDDGAVLEKIRKAYGREWLKTAPVIIVACGNHATSWKRPMDGKDHTDVDVSIAIDHLSLAAADNGLATCWICLFEPDVITDALNLPGNWEPIALIPIGFPDDEVNIERHERLRKPLKEIVSFNIFKE